MPRLYSICVEVSGQPFWEILEKYFDSHLNSKVGKVLYFQEKRENNCTMQYAHSLIERMQFHVFIFPKSKMGFSGFIRLANKLFHKQEPLLINNGPCLPTILIMGKMNLDAWILNIKWILSTLFSFLESFTFDVSYFLKDKIFQKYPCFMGFCHLAFFLNSSLMPDLDIFILFTK